MTNIAKCDAAERKYHVVALEVPIVFNRDGDHDHNGLIFALGHNKQALDCQGCSVLPRMRGAFS
jgi:hypothetical protein